MKITIHTIDLFATARKYTDEGFLVVPAKIARTGVQEYRAFELGINDGDPLRVIRIYRSPDEVFNPDSMASFESKPVTDNHPSEFVDAKNWKDLSVGFARNVRRDGDYLVADLVVTDQKAIDLINSGKVELSNGYGAEYDWTPGKTADGQPYDAQQKNIRGNHVALVDRARCGPACRVSDSLQPNQGAKTMAVKMTIDGIPFDFEEGAAAAVTKLIQANDELQKASKAPALFKVGDKELTAEEVSALITAKDGEIETLKKDVMTPDQRDAMVEVWAKLIADAGRIVKGFDHKGKTCDAIRREVLAKAVEDAAKKPVIDAALGGLPVADAPADLVKVAFNVLAAVPAAEKTPSNDGKPNPVAQAMRDQAGGATEELSGRDAYIQSMTDAWKTPHTQE